METAGPPSLIKGNGRGDLFRLAAPDIQSNTAKQENKMLAIIVARPAVVPTHPLRARRSRCSFPLLTAQISWHPRAEGGGMDATALVVDEDALRRHSFDLLRFPMYLAQRVAPRVRIAWSMTARRPT